MIGLLSRCDVAERPMPHTKVMKCSVFGKEMVKWGAGSPFHSRLLDTGEHHAQAHQEDLRVSFVTGTDAGSGMGTAIPVGGLFIDDISGGSTPKAIPAGTSVPAGGWWVMNISRNFFNNTGDISTNFFNNTGDSVRLMADASGVTVYDSMGYTVSAFDQVLHRIGDGGAWCSSIAGNVTKGTANPSTCP
ncbi:MAG: hypothetical protein ACYCV4_03495 [Dermatophilaceae bacterium]